MESENKKLLLPTPAQWSAIVAIAESAAKSGLKGCSNTGANAIRILLGLEHGLSAGVSLTEFQVLEGRLSPSSVLQAALIGKNGLGRYEVIESTESLCHLRAWRTGEPEPQDFITTIEDAHRRGLHKTGTGKTKPAWISHTRNMLHHETIRTMGRIKFPETLIGVGYTAEELGIETDEDGNVDYPVVQAPDPGSLPGFKPIAAVVPEPTTVPIDVVVVVDGPASGGPPPITAKSLEGKLATIKQAGMIPAVDAWRKFLHSFSLTANSIEDFDSVVLEIVSHHIHALSEIAAHVTNYPNTRQRVLAAAHCLPEQLIETYKDLDQLRAIEKEVVRDPF